MEWITTLNQALEYIEQNLTTELMSDDVARSAFYSSYHFQRIFTLLTGYTVCEYIRNRRLALAAQELRDGNTKVIDLAYKYGYETPESFTKAFQRFHGVLPTQARNHEVSVKAFNRLTIKVTLEGGAIMDYHIENRPAFEVCLKIRSFSTNDSNTAIPQFWNDYFTKGLDKAVCPMLGVCLPTQPGSKDFEYGIGCETQYVNQLPQEFTKVEIPANTWAIFKCIGPMPDAIQAMWKRVYSEWLPHSNYELVLGYDFEYYTGGDTSSQNYESEIWIPVKLKKTS